MDNEEGHLMQIIKQIEDMVVNNWIGIFIGVFLAYVVYNYSYIFGMQVAETNPNFQYLFILIGAIIGMIIDSLVTLKR